ncbi:MAG: hypothetical protein IT438_06050 [Phycisphaerales bacterium]|nr:hypothetical protein [Phycisphaerales bacterium]
MEERQTKIREGAGLEESRLNTEFIDLLKKYSTPIMLVVVVVAGGYFLWNYYKKAQERGIDQAFSEFDAAAKSGSPVSLLRVADEQNRLAVPYMARLAAADIHLSAARSGTPIGATFQEGKPGVLAEGTSPLTPEQRTEELGKAEGLYKQVYDGTTGNLDRAVHTLGALNGLAACAEQRGQVDAARGHYQQVIDLCNKIGNPEGAKIAQEMIDTLSIVQSPPKLYSEASLPKPAADIAPFVSPMTNVKMIGADGKEISPGQPGSDGVHIEQVPAPEGATPAPASTAPAAPPATPAPATPAPSTGGNEPK